MSLIPPDLTYLEVADCFNFWSMPVFAGFFQGVEKTMVKTGKNCPGKNRFWTGFFHLGGKNTLADRVVATEAEKTLKICDSLGP